jgi:hypothetical protein
MKLKYAKKLEESRYRVSRYNYAGRPKPQRKFQPMLIDKFSGFDDFNDFKIKKYLHPDELYIEQFIQISINYFELPPFVAERTKHIFTSAWNHQKILLQNINEENAVLGVLLYVVYTYYKNGSTIDIENFVMKVWGNDCKKHVLQVYFVYDRICSLYNESIL